MSQLVPALKPTISLKVHKPIFFTSMYLISIATGGHKPSLESFGADQFNHHHPTERGQKPSFFNYWNLGLCSGLLLGVTLIVYLEDQFGFGLATIALTLTMLLSLLIFLLGRPFYRFRAPEVGLQLQDLKPVLSAVPIWLTALPFGISVAQTSTFFIKQGGTMNRKLADGFEIPPASVYALGAVAMIVSVVSYEKLLVPFLRRATGNERGISLLQRIGTGMALSVVAMGTAAVVERKRRRAVGESMSVLWLVPQLMIFGMGDGFAIVGLQEFFYDQMPDKMRSMGISLYLSVMGMASFLSSVLISVVDHVTGKMEGGSWFGKELNKSRLDLFYWLLAGINGVNLCVYVFVARRYSYKCVERRVGVNVSQEKDEGGILTT